MSRAPRDVIADRSPALCWFFTGVMTWQMRGAFRALRVARPVLPPLPADRPVIVVATHPSWWDPALFIVLQRRLFPGRPGFGPIEAAQLDRYRFFRRIGLWGVEEGRAGAEGFLRTSARVLEDPRRMIWITAQGRFADPRERPLGLRPGAAHLLAAHPEAVALPLAVEYPFWTERRPEALVAFGAPLEGGGTRRGQQERLEAALTATADRLAELSMAREAAAFETVLGGRRGTGGVYGGWQRLRAGLSGTPHRVDHGT
jgi:1-acyl-sn-glycerol-3-phosphate acyltransferase